MSCDNVQELISSLLDGRMAAGERENVLAHIGRCRQCSAHWESTESLRTALLDMSGPVVPQSLAARLRVLASHERERKLAHANIAARWQHWASRLQLSFENLMRPLALPFAGGLLSTLLSFGLLVPNLSFSHDRTGTPDFFANAHGEIVTNPYGQIEDGDVPIPRIESVTALSNPYDNVVELTIDEKGRVSDYLVVRGTLTDDLKSIIMFSYFEPATMLGLPTSAKVRVVQSPSVLPSVIVKG